MVMSDTSQIQGVLLVPDKEGFVEIHKSIAKTLKEEGIELNLIDASPPTGSVWIVRVREAIKRARFIIADITGENPNAMYEIGFAHGLRKPVLPIVKRGSVDRVPDIVAGYVYLEYDPKNLDDLGEEIRSWALSQRSLAERAQAIYEAKNR